MSHQSCINSDGKRFKEHRFIRGTSICGNGEVGILCTQCYRAVQPNDKMTPAEVKTTKATWKAQNKDRSTLHKVYHAWVKTVGVKRGYEAMRIADRFHKKYPNDTRLVGVDDDHHCGSDLLLIDHVSPHSGYWGTTVIYIPQCSGAATSEFFLYPGHRAGLLDAIKAITAKAKKIKKHPLPWPIKKTVWKEKK